MPNKLSFLEDFPYIQCLGIVGVILLAIVLWMLCKKIFRRYGAKSGERATLSHALLSLIRLALVLLVVLVSLDICGINVTSAVAGLGIASAIVGLALQDLLKDMIMGTHILSDRFFVVGDCVEIDGQEGIVRQFTIKTTKLELLKDGSEVSLCNRNIERVRILSRMQDMDIPLSYDSDPEQMCEVLKRITQTAAQIEGVDDCRFIGIGEFADSAILYKIRFFCEPKDRLVLRREVLLTVRRELHREGITIPFNQLDVHIDSE